MSIVSKPVGFALGGLTLCALVYFFQSDAPTVAQKPKSTTVAKKDDSVEPAYLPEDFVKHFDHGSPCEKNIFAAPAAVVAGKPLASVGLIDKVPAELADGDSNWVFTGIAVLDGKKMALLENSSTHKGDYVTEGAAWKSAKILRISADGVAFGSKKSAGELVVYRFKPTSSPSTTSANPGAGSLPPAGPIQPMDPAQISGPIGIPGMRRIRSFGAGAGGGGITITSVSSQ